MGPGGFCSTNPDLADILGRTDLDIEIFDLFLFGIPNCWISWSPDLQKSAPGLGSEIAGAPSAAALRQLRTTKLGRSKELILSEPHQCKPCLGNEDSIHLLGIWEIWAGFDPCMNVCLLCNPDLMHV